MLVSVVMSVYNGEKYLRQAMDSILNQTYKNIEFLIIDDGSTDSSLKIIENYSDERIRLIKNDGNKGLIYSLNKGFSLANGKYIARMDCDDISYKNRLEKQVEYMEKNNDVAVLGTGVKIIFEGIPFLAKKNIPNDSWEYLKIKSFFATPFVHPSAMIRKSDIDSKNLEYRDEFKYAEDYGLWTDIIKDKKCTTIKEPLLKYRIVKQSVTRKANRDIIERKQVFIKIYDNYFEKYGIILSEKELEMHFEICMIQNMKECKYSIEEKEKYIKNLKFKLCEKGIKKSIIDQVISEVFIKTYLYSDISQKFMDCGIVTYSNIKKLYLVEKIKLQVKKVYK